MAVGEPEGRPVGFAACIPGTGDGYLGLSFCQDILSSLRAKGFRTGSFKYPTLRGLGCKAISEKAKTIQSMVDAAAGGLPVVVIGGSQGAWIAGQMQAKAALLYGDGLHVTSPVSISLPCNANAKPLWLRAVSGRSDSVYAHPLEPQLSAITGVSCSRSPCGTDRRGWMIVSDGQTRSGRAGHAFASDPEWRRTGEPWGLRGSVAWVVEALRGR